LDLVEKKKNEGWLKHQRKPGLPRPEWSEIRREEKRRKRNRNAKRDVNPKKKKQRGEGGTRMGKGTI